MRRKDAQRLSSRDQAWRSPLRPPADCVDVAQVTVYARAFGVAMAKKSYDTHESSERAALKELLSTLELEGTLIQADALHTTQAFFAGASPRAPTCS